MSSGETPGTNLFIALTDAEPRRSGGGYYRRFFTAVFVGGNTVVNVFEGELSEAFDYRDRRRAATRFNLTQITFRAVSDPSVIDPVNLQISTDEIARDAVAFAVQQCLELDFLPVWQVEETDERMI